MLFDSLDGLTYLTSEIQISHYKPITFVNLDMEHDVRLTGVLNQKLIQGLQ